MTVIANMIIMMHGYSTTEISCSGDVLEPIFQVFEFAMRDWVTGAAFVSVGVAVAPYSKRIVSIVLSTSFVSLSIVGTVFILAFNGIIWTTIIFAISSCCGAIIAAYLCYKEYPFEYIN